MFFPLHFIIIQVITNYLDLKLIYSNLDKKISKEFVQLWSNFAKTTYPVGEDKTFQWEQAETSQRR